MKLGSLIGAVAIASVGFTPAHAGEHWIGVEMGGSVPFGYLSDDARTGTLVGVTYTHMMNRVIGLGVDFERHGWQAKDAHNVEAEAVYGPSTRLLMTAWQYTAHATLALPLPGPVKPYAVGGGGLYNPGAKILTPLSPRSDKTDKQWGFQAGGGLRLPGPGGTSLDLFASFYQYQSRPLNTAWATAGLRINWRLQDLDAGL